MLAAFVAIALLRAPSASDDRGGIAISADREDMGLEPSRS